MLNVLLHNLGFLCLELFKCTPTAEVETLLDKLALGSDGTAPQAAAFPQCWVSYTCLLRPFKTFNIVQTALLQTVERPLHQKYVPLIF